MSSPFLQDIIRNFKLLTTDLKNKAIYFFNLNIPGFLDDDYILLTTADYLSFVTNIVNNTEQSDAEYTDQTSDTCSFTEKFVDIGSAYGQVNPKITNINEIELQNHSIFTIKHKNLDGETVELPIKHNFKKQRKVYIFKKFCESHSRMFYKDEKYLPYITNFSAKLNVRRDTKLPNYRSYPMAPSRQKVLINLLNTMNFEKIYDKLMKEEENQKMDDQIHGKTKNYEIGTLAMYILQGKKDVKFGRGRLVNIRGPEVEIVDLNSGRHF